MKTHRVLVCLIFATFLALSCSMAGDGEVVRFQDGRYLKVEGHQVHGDAVKLMMANQSVVILPLDRIDTIRSGRVVLYAATENELTPATDLQAVVRNPRSEYPDPGTKKRG